MQEGTGPLTPNQIIGLVGQDNINVYYILGARGYRLQETAVCTPDFNLLGKVNFINGIPTQYTFVPYGTLLTLVVYRILC